VNDETNELHASGAFYASFLPKPVKLTAIIPHYNHSDKLGLALGALERSTRRPDQIIVVDDGSEPKHKEQARITCWVYGATFVQHGSNKGVPEALNTGIICANCEWVYFGAADDTVYPMFFEQAMISADEHPKCGVVSGMGEWADSGGARITVGYPHQAYFEPERCGSQFIPAHAAIYRNTPGLKFMPDAGPFADWLLTQEAALTHGAAFTGAVGGRFNLSGGTFYHRGDRKKAWCAVIGRLIARGMIERVQLHVLGFGAFDLLPTELRTFRRLAQFRWHAFKAKLWRKLPQWTLDLWTGQAI
jgi:hypothetical protein